MSRTRRLAVIVAAWAIPVVWVTAALLAGPSDGTCISPPTAMLGGDRWGDSATVVRAYGGTPLQEGDLILAIDGRPFGEWLSGAPPEPVAGEAVYRIQRSGAALDRILDVDVPLTRYPLLCTGPTSHAVEVGHRLDDDSSRRCPAA